MAEAPKITLSVESVVHKMFRELAEAIYDQHRVRVDRVTFDWVNVSTVSLYREILVSVEAQTTTKGLPGGGTQ